MSTTPITGSSGASASNSSPSAASIGGVAPSEGTFLTLLVSQLKNQDPLNPTDSTQFVSELAQFSSLEQMIGINQNVGAIKSAVAPQATAPASTAATSGAASPATVPGSISTDAYSSLLNSIG